MITGFTCSTFDLFHAGHNMMLKEVREQCDFLIVGLQTDPTIDRPNSKNKPIQSLFERYMQLNGSRYIDQIIVYQTEADLENFMKVLPINVRFLGEEYRGKDFTGKAVCADRGIKIVYNSRNHNFSTTDLRVRTWQGEENSAKKQKELLNG